MPRKDIRVAAVRREAVDIDKLVSALLLLLRELDAADQVANEANAKEPAA